MTRGPKIMPGLLLIASMLLANMANADTAILLHGLAKSSFSMRFIEQALMQQGFKTCNISYPSTTANIEALAKDHVYPNITACRQKYQLSTSEPLYFVTHSMGGIVLRYLAAKLNVSVARAVMLSPPNQGSEIIDTLKKFPVGIKTLGKSAAQLGTEASQSLPQQLGAVDFPLGVITGNRSMNPVLSWLIPGPDDGKVAVSRSHVQGEADFLVLSSSHPLISYNQQAIAQTLYFFHHGHFNPTPRHSAMAPDFATHTAN